MNTVKAHKYSETKNKAMIIAAKNICLNSTFSTVINDIIIHRAVLSQVGAHGTLVNIGPI